MVKVSYEAVSLAIEKMWWQALTNNFDMFETHSQVMEFIEACGWTTEAFDQETLKRINGQWD